MFRIREVDSVERRGFGEAGRERAEMGDKNDQDALGTCGNPSNSVTMDWQRILIQTFPWHLTSSSLCKLPEKGFVTHGFHSTA